MSTGAWIGWIVAVLAIAAFVVVLVIYLRRPTDARLVKAMSDAQQAQLNATVRERQYSNMIDGLRKEIDNVRKIKDEKQRLAALAALGNRLH